MKTFLIAAFALVLSATARPAAAQAVETERSEPSATAETTRPLLRFLIGGLQLPDQQALAVSRILQVEIAHRPLPTIETLSEALAPVLTAAQLARFQTLEPAPELTRDLRYLAALR